MNVQIEAHHYELSAAENERIEKNLRALRELVGEFPLARLHILVNHHPRTGDFHVKTSLKLPRRTLFTGERHDLFHPAFERCVRKLMDKVTTYKEQLREKPAHERVVEGKWHELHPSAGVDLAALETAVRDADYAAFRRLMLVYESDLEKRVGRWIKRYPEVEAMLGREVTIGQIVEDVFVAAFDRFLERPTDRLGHWLEQLIDGSIKALLVKR